MAPGVVRVAVDKWCDAEEQHVEWLRGIFGSDREVQELQDMARRVEREHKIS
jgi:hypothetical protein